MTQNAPCQQKDPDDWMKKYFPQKFSHDDQSDAWYFLASETIDDGVWESMYETAFSNTAYNGIDDQDLEKLGLDRSGIPVDDEMGDGTAIFNDKNDL